MRFHAQISPYSTEKREEKVKGQKEAPKTSESSELEHIQCLGSDYKDWKLKWHELVPENPRHNPESIPEVDEWNNSQQMGQKYFDEHIHQHEIRSRGHFKACLDFLNPMCIGHECKQHARKKRRKLSHIPYGAYDYHHLKEQQEENDKEEEIHDENNEDAEPID